LAWGLTYAQGMCMSCYNFTGRYRDLGDCAGCQRGPQPLRRDYCRLCWHQAYLDRPSGPNTPLAPYLIKVCFQQLFLADLDHRRAAPRRIERRHGAKGRPHKPPPAVVARPVPGWLQPPLFDDVLPRRYRWRRVDLRNGPPPDNPWLAYGLHLAHAMAETRGFSIDKRMHLQRVLVMLLANHQAGELIRASDFDSLIHRHGGNVEHTVAVLDAMEVLADDRPTTLDIYLNEKLGALSAGIAAETQRWLHTLREGGPRSKPRKPETVNAYLRQVHPALLDWSGRYDHLREVTREDIHTHLTERPARQRSYALTALRSLFGWAKKNGVVFGNPTTRLRVEPPAERIWQPLTTAQLSPTLTAATTPVARVCVVLAGVHAARHSEIRLLQLEDVDLANRRITIAGHERPLDDLTRRVITGWLDYRRGRWPNTANRHLLLSQESAVNLGPISRPLVGHLLRGLPGTLESLRIDRQLEEAVTSGADPLHLAVVFGLNESTAVRYANNARRLLSEDHAAMPVSSARTQVPDDDNDRGEHSGSP